MKRYIDELVDRINNLIKIYENYIWKSDDRNLVVVFQKDLIISFYLFEKGELVDELYLSFEENEKNFYNAVCLRTFALLLGNVMVYKADDNEHNVYLNNSLKSYLAVIAGDEEVASLIDSLIEVQDKEIINKDNKIIKEASKKIKKRLPNVSVLNQIDKRISLSREMLRR